MASRSIKITVINDLVCPFCYIGHKELLSAVAQCAGLPVTFEIEYRPFRITTVPEGSSVDKKTYYLNKLGLEKYESVGKVIQEWGDRLGLNLNLQDGVISSTIRAHRLTMKAYRLGGQLYQLPLLSAIFKAYTSEAKDIGSLDVLSDIAESAGVMSKQEAIEFLKGDELKEEVLKTAENAKLNGIKGVPITIIEGKWMLSGGQKAEVFVQIFEKLASTAPGSAPSPFPDPVVETRTECAA